MKDFFKTIFTLFIVSTAFFMGYFLGEEKIRSQIPNFQEDREGGD